MRKIITLFVVAAFVALSTVSTQPLVAADDKPADKKETPVRPIPFRGKIAAVDKQAKTVKVGERTFQITSDTRIMKAGKAATLEDAAVGDDVGGQYREGADKKLNVVSLRVGPRPDAPPKQDDKK